MEKNKRKGICCPREAGPAAGEYYRLGPQHEGMGGISVLQLFTFSVLPLSVRHLLPRSPGTKPQMQHLHGSARQDGEFSVGACCNESHLCLFPSLAAPAGIIAEYSLSKTKRLKSVFQQWALCKVAASLWITPFPDLSEMEHSSQLSLHQTHKPRNIIKGDVLAGSLCQAWGKGSVLRKHDQKFNKWSYSQTWMLIQ